MSADSFTVLVGGHRTSLSPAEIDRELASMWKPLSEEQGGAVSRVVLGNVLWLGEVGHLEDVQRVVARVVPKFPCRLFLLAFDPAQDSEHISASVNAQCFKPEPKAAPVCCEVIRLAFGPNGARHVRGCVAPLLVSDLQTVLWVDSSDTVTPLLKELEDDADRTIHLISRAADPSARLREIIEDQHPAYDLSWFRMKPIRDQVAAFFDDPATGFDLRHVKEVRVTAGHHRPGSSLPEIMAAMFLGWFGSRLGWQAGRGTASGYWLRAEHGEIHVRMRACPPPEPGAGASPISLIEMTDTNGQAFRLGFACHGETVEMKTGDAPETERRLCLRELGEPEAMGLALNHPVRVETFRAAARIAQPLLEYYCS